MSEKKYDKTSPQSIYEYALELTGKCISDVVALPDDINDVKNKGQLGNFLEKYYFNKPPSSNHGPDFAEANLELKLTGVVRSPNGEYKAKERLVLTMINYESILRETFTTSSLVNKCQLMLIMFYEYELDVPVQNLVFPIKPLLYSFSGKDLDILQEDWEFIQQKIENGLAHELSEGDTNILGACRKGAGGEQESLRRQPNSNVGAPARAFSFKQGYLNRLLQEHINGADVKPVPTLLSLETETAKIFEDYLGKAISEIGEDVGYVKTSPNQKGYNRLLLNRILQQNNHRTLDLESEDIELKTIRLDKNGAPKEHMSFPGFDFLEITRQDWEDSRFFEKLEKRFLFAIFKEDDAGVERLEKVAYWSMPYEDKVEARKIWKDTKRRVSIDCTNLPSSTESRVAHVRPKGSSGDDKSLTPQGTYVVKQCFWLNKGYIKEVVEKL